MSAIDISNSELRVPHVQTVERGGQHQGREKREERGERREEDGGAEPAI